MRGFRTLDGVARVWDVKVWGALAVGALLLGTGSLALAGDAPRQAPGGAKTEREQSLVELGRRLFFDPRASRTGARSCASCHDPAHGFSDPATYSDDELGPTRRHSQTLLNSHKNPSAHWDGEFGSVEQLVLARVGALQGGHHGFGDVTTKAEERERSRQGRRAIGNPSGPAVTAKGSPAPTAAETPAPADSGSGPAAAEPDPAAAGPATATPAPQSSPASEENAGPGSEGFVPTPRDNPAYVGRFAQPGGSVGFGLRARSDGPTEEPAAAEPTPATTPAEGTAEPAEEAAPAAPAEAGPGAATPAPAATTAPASPKSAESAQDQERRRREEEQAKTDAVARLPRVAEVLEGGGRYREAFKAAFGSETVSDVRIAQAVAAYVRTIRSTPSAYDRYGWGEAEALSPLARQGLALFRGRAGCAQCHSLEGSEAALTDYAFHNTGIVWREVPAGVDLTPKALDAALDAGRLGVSSRPMERRAFKTPTLRDVALRAPYMHDGSLATLTDVVKHYAGGGSKDPQQDARIKPFTVSVQETAALVAFLEHLTGGTRAGRAESSWGRRAESTVLTVEDANHKPLAGVLVRLVPVGDALPTAHPVAREIALVTDERGRVTFTPPQGFTHIQAVLPADMGRLPEEWIPDSARTAVVRAPVLGRVRLVITATDVRELPDVLAMEFPGVKPAPGQPEPRNTLTRVGAVTGDAGLKTALYAGWVREDLPAMGSLRLPGTTRVAVNLKLEAGATLSVDLR
jgi:cytochrome c peroxidase